MLIAMPIASEASFNCKQLKARRALMSSIEKPQTDNRDKYSSTALSVTWVNVDRRNQNIAPIETWLTNENTK
ncbi:hypothetical protein GJ744_011883 [Endocarpon pusillum]|uniref:Uncharacterized protein n=1 Tax=Endocarpon pusillum TaxID=364733 RepID=A0A8H7ABX8_9EURO|nr:hypothetical protein GJ744_011883 [Endocarpon pusillum]